MKILAQDFPLPGSKKEGWPWTNEFNDNDYNAHINSPKISIITPSYNQGHFIEETIRSILLQNYPNLEYIVVDGGSTDNTIEILKKYDKYITYWVSEKDKGTFDALNKALIKFTGDYWCVVNSDDTLKKGALGTVADFIAANNSPEWMTGGIEFIDEQSTVLGKSVPAFPPKVAGYYFLNECWIVHNVTFLSRKFFEKVGMFNKLDVMDHDYWIRAEMMGMLPALIETKLGCIRYHSDCKSMDFSNIIKMKSDIFQSYLPAIKNENDRKELKRHIRAKYLYAYQLKMKYDLFEKRYVQAFSLLISTLAKYPEELAKKWPYGFVKRFFTGIDESEFSVVHFLKKLK